MSTEIAEAAAEVVAESVDGIVETIEVVRNNPKLLVFACLAGVGLGFGGGYIFSKKKTAARYEEIIDREIEEARVFYRSLNKVDEEGKPVTPMDYLLETQGDVQVSEVVRTYKGTERVEEVVLDVEPYDEIVDDNQLRKIEHRLRAEELNKSKNVFDPKDEPADPRDYTKPYVLTHDEYFTAEKEYEQLSLTYYEGDKTLANERDEPVADVESLVGKENLLRFGSGSKDPNIVYIRNDHKQLDCEVVRSSGSYVDEVLGLDVEPPKNEMKHSAQARRRREFRHGDD